MMFTKEEKVELFDKISERYYNHNFGTVYGKIEMQKKGSKSA